MKENEITEDKDNLNMEKSNYEYVQKLSYDEAQEVIGVLIDKWNRRILYKMIRDVVEKKKQVKG